MKTMGSFSMLACSNPVSYEAGLFCCTIDEKVRRCWQSVLTKAAALSTMRALTGPVLTASPSPVLPLRVSPSKLAGSPCLSTFAEKEFEIESVDIAAARNGDQDAYARLIHLHQQQLSQHLWRFTRDAGIHEELLHDTFVEAWFSLENFGQRGHFIGWLKTIATRLGYKYWKEKQKRQQQQPLSSIDLKSLADMETREFSSDEATEILHNLLGQLPPRDRLVLTLLYWDECSIAQAAELAGWSQTMVKVQAHRARNKLKKLLEHSK